MIPIFYHVPKCAGTYIKNITTRLLINLSDNQLSIYHCLDKDNNILKLVWCDNTPLEIEKKFFPGRKAHFQHHFQVQYDDFISHKDELHQIYAVMIESHGFKIHKELLSDFPDAASFMILRDPFNRQQSLYNYITAGRSHHEKSHGSLKSKSLEEFLGSYEVEDCWLIRQFLDLPDDHIITQEDFEATCNILQNIHISDIAYTLETVDKIFSKCHNITTKSINTDVYGHVSNVPKISKDDIDKDILWQFNKRTAWDQKLYAHFTQS